MAIPFYILIEVEKGQAVSVAQGAAKIRGVKMAHNVTGTIDVIVYAEADDFSEIRRIRNAVYAIIGVLRTQTAIHT